jgi:CheY-like chemotaxis protein
VAPKHILIVDDEPLILFSWAVVLRQEGYRVSTVDDGYQALDRVQGAFAPLDPVDLVLTDLRMPGMDGLELAQRLRAGNASLPILAITAWGDQGVREKFLALGCRGYLEKPVEPGSLIEIVGRVLAGTMDDEPASRAVSESPVLEMRY